MKAPMISAIELKKDNLVSLFQSQIIPISIFGECIVRALATRSMNILTILVKIAKNAELTNDCSLPLNDFECAKNSYLQISRTLEQIAPLSIEPESDDSSSDGLCSDSDN